MTHCLEGLDLIVHLPGDAPVEDQLEWAEEHLRAHSIGREGDLQAFVDTNHVVVSPNDAIVIYTRSDGRPHLVRWASPKSFPREVRCVRCGRLGEWTRENDPEQERLWTEDGVKVPTDLSTDLSVRFEVTDSDVRWY